MHGGADVVRDHAALSQRVLCCRRVGSSAPGVGIAAQSPGAHTPRCRGELEVAVDEHPALLLLAGKPGQERVPSGLCRPRDRPAADEGAGPELGRFIGDRRAPRFGADLDLALDPLPPGKGDPRWQERTDRLSLGAEQEHLNNVFGARLRITGLRAPGGGPGIELLEYLAPSDGRPYPLDSRASDLWHWQTRIVTADPMEAARDARAGGGRWVSPGAVALPGRDLRFASGALVRDPDGHALLLVAP